MRHHIRIAVLALLASGLGLSAPLAAQDGPVLAGAPPVEASAEPASERLTSREIGNWLRQVDVKPPKPGGGAAPSTRYTGNDTCQWANDGECDDPGIGTGACQVGTDYSDCWRIVEGVEDNTCRWANDGECDEPGFGTGACTQGTDLADCGAIIELRFRNDSCETAAAHRNAICTVSKCYQIVTAILPPQQSHLPCGQWPAATSAAGCGGL